MIQISKGIANAVSIFTHLSKKEKILAYVMLAFVGTALIDLGIVRPFTSRIDQLNKKIQATETQIKGDLRLVALGTRIETQRATYGSYIGTAQTDNEEANIILKEIESLADKATINIIEMKPPSGVKEVGQIKKYSVPVNCEGTMEKLIEFMYSIETAKMLLTIDKYELTPKSKDTDLVKASMTISKLALK